jgi:hypothetical protein
MFVSGVLCLPFVVVMMMYIRVFIVPHFESHWAGSAERLHQLFYHTRNAKQPIWDAALHLRVQFSFVER